MFRKILLISALITVFSASTSLFAQAADPTATPHDPETEQDYSPGFWKTDVDTTLEDHVGGEHNAELLSPDQEQVTEETIYRENSFRAFIAPLVNFAQTIWNECDDSLTGNYDVYACSKKRKISVILDTYLKNRLLSCVDEGLKTVGSGKAEALHIVHAGITGDARHSPRSLHAHNRAIDVKVLKVLLQDGSTKQFTYSKTGNRAFYESVRKCWGQTVSTYNGCPLYRGNKMLTGSIGWENADHGRHMHLSVPYCLSGRYGAGVWQR